MTEADTEPFGALAPGWFDRMIIALTSRLPDSWLGLRLAILFRHAVAMRLDYPGGALDVERWGLRMRLHPRDNGCEKNLLFTPQMYEPTELKELGADIDQAKRRQSPFVFVDIGANVGLFSLFVAAHAGTDARILAIEPEPGNLSRLNFNVSANPCTPIKILPIALSDEMRRACGGTGLARPRRHPDEQNCSIRCAFERGACRVTETLAAPCVPAGRGR